MQELQHLFPSASVGLFTSLVIIVNAIVHISKLTFLLSRRSNFQIHLCLTTLLDFSDIVIKVSISTLFIGLFCIYIYKLFKKKLA